MRTSLFYLFLLSFLSFSQGATFSSFQGTYGGVSIGMNNIERRTEVHVETRNSLYHESLSTTAVHGGVILGYGNVFSNHLYMGIESSYHFIPTKETLKTRPRNGYITTSFPVEGKLRIGYVFGNVLPFVKIGYSYHELTIDHPSAGSKGFKSGGILLGSGIDFAVDEKVKVGFSYSFSMHQSLSYQNINYNPSFNMFKMRILYHF